MTKTRYVWTPEGVKRAPDPDDVWTMAYSEVDRESHCAGCGAWTFRMVELGWTRVHTHNTGPAYWYCPRCAALATLNGWLK